MESEGSLPHSQQTATCPYPEPVRSSPCPTFHFLKIYLNIIPPSMRRSSNWSLSLRFPPKPVYTALLPHKCYMPRPSHFSFFDHANKMRTTLKILISKITYKQLSYDRSISNLSRLLIPFLSLSSQFHLLEARFRSYFLSL